jgi:hypothetical protein
MNGQTETNVTVVKRASTLDIAESALSALGGMAHHTTMNEWIESHGLNGDGVDISTAVWNDARKNGEQSKFRFMRRGVFALATFTGDTSEEAIKQLLPERKKPAAKPMSDEARAAKIAKLEQELARLKG